MKEQDYKQPSQVYWTSVQAYALAAVCLLVGVAAGWLVRGSQSAGTAQVESAAAASNSVPGQPTPEQMKQMAEKQAGPLLAQLKSDPNNTDLLANVGNIYYDTQQFPAAIEYYQQVLKLQPANTGVRTDLATAYWYQGNADAAIAEFNRTLSYEPTKANTLFNLGIVKWQGKEDIKGAVDAWQKLLDTNPNYENRDKVTQLIAQAKQHSGIIPGSKSTSAP